MEAIGGASNMAFLTQRQAQPRAFGAFGGDSSEVPGSGEGVSADQKQSQELKGSSYEALIFTTAVQLVGENGMAKQDYPPSCGEFW